MKKQQKPTDTMFAKWGSDDNFFTLSGRARRVADAILGVFGGHRMGDQKATYDITAFVGRKVDPKVPSLGDPRHPGRSATVNISGAGHVDRKVHDIGGDGRRTAGIPDISGRRNEVPALGDSADPGQIPDISGGENVLDGAPNISGGPSGDGFEAISDAGQVIGQGMLAMVGMHELLPEDARKVQDFAKRARQIGLPLSTGCQLEIQRRIMRDLMTADSLWQTWVGKEIRDRERVHNKYQREQRRRMNEGRMSVKDRIKWGVDNWLYRHVPLDDPVTVSKRDFFGSSDNAKETV